MCILSETCVLYIYILFFYSPELFLHASLYVNIFLLIYGYSYIYSPQEETEEVMIPAEKVGMVIGKGGETINRLQDRSGARLQMIQDDPFAREKPLRMTGNRDAIERAKQLVKELLDPEPENDVVFPSMLGPSSGDIVNNLGMYKSKKIEVKILSLCRL